MYPSQENPSYGVFVMNFKKGLENLGCYFISNSVIKNQANSIFKKSLIYLNHYYSVIKNYSKENYDVVYCHYLSHNAPVLLFVFLIFGIKKPVVINVHGSDVINSKGKYFDKLNHKVLSKINLVVVPSKYFEMIMLEQYPSLTKDKIYISPSGGINTKIFYETKLKENGFQNKIELGFVSRIDKGKGWDDFLYTLFELKIKAIPFHAKIAGTGSQREELISLIEKLDLTNEVDYLGVVKQAQLLEFYNSLDVFVFPSRRKAESLGLVGLEAMSCGVPVIGSNIAGIQTYVKDKENGFLFAPGDIMDLENKIVEFYNLSKKSKNNLKINAVKTAKDYDSSQVSMKLLSKLEEYIS